MNPRAIPAVVRAGARQAAGDLRPVLWGRGLVGQLVWVVVIIVVARIFDGPDSDEMLFGPMFLAGSIGGYGFLVAMVIVGETYNDRLGGALLRVRILPNGPLIWAVGKTFSSVGQTILTQVAVLVGGTLFHGSWSWSAPQILLCLPIALLAAVSAAPLGFLAGSLARGIFSIMLGFLPMVAVMVTSGVFCPLDVFPRWLQGIQLVLPAYWSGHLTRWVLVGDPSWEFGGAFAPALAVGVLVAWIVIGYAAVPAVIRRTFRKESIGSLARMQSTIRSQAGL
ncbi:ABC-2 type transporter [Propionibacterium ruminifibrarum]|uniref:ABC-2 type transporter n=1 Tax=Propionibacterium ruminifibrarum TaxID=1962131 RepID=A0A375I4M4_9ACTN|nr:ABC transporter permease [Propionibacterium ruminifibrarum]SPF68178.1 ABC-2 type transporter [Propionibacterium ruminifibrarum]